MALLPTASISTQAAYLRTGFWNWFGTSPRSFNLSTTGTGAQTVSRELIYDYDGFSNVAGAGTDVDGLSAARRVLVDRVLKDIGAKFNITFRHALATDPIGNVDLFFKDNAGGAFSNSTLFSTGNTAFATNHKFIDHSWVNVEPGWYGSSSADNDYTYQTFYHEILHAIGLGHTGPFNGSATYITDSAFATSNNNAYINDSWEMSIMSYFDQFDNTTVPGSSTNFVVTMMAADVEALRTYYGSSAFTGNTIYGVGTNILASTSYILANLSTFANQNAFCIVDDGGIDTIDFSNFSVNQRLDLSIRSATDIGNFGNTTSDIGGRIRNMTLAAGTVIENGILGAGNDTIIGNTANNNLNGGGGNDTISAGDGADTLNGGDGNDSLNGEAGNDSLNGGTGVDTMAGGMGDDIYVVDNVGDVVTEAAAAGTDQVQSSITYTLGANVENLTLTGAASINGTGNGLANSLVGNNGQNLLDGAGGADTMAGGLANDTYFVDNVGDVVIEAAGAGTDRVQASITHTLAANVENLTLTGAAAINGTGNGLANSLVGNIANNMLNGGDGADSLNGGGGADSLTGSLAADTFIFQFGQSINSSFDTIMDFEVGIDRIDLLTAGGAALATPTSFSRATNNSTALTLSALASAVFADADGFAAGNQPLGLNAAGLVVSTVAAIAGNYLIINDGTLGYQSLTDLVIKVNLSSGSLPAPGGITASTWFV